MKVLILMSTFFSFLTHAETNIVRKAMNGVNTPGKLHICRIAPDYVQIRKIGEGQPFWKSVTFNREIRDANTLKGIMDEAFGAPVLWTNAPVKTTTGREEWVETYIDLGQSRDSIIEQRSGRDLVAISSSVATKAILDFAKLNCGF